MSTQRIAAELTLESYYKNSFYNVRSQVSFLVRDTAVGRFILFPGTHQPRDWLTNLKFWLTCFDQRSRIPLKEIVSAERDRLVRPYADRYEGEVRIHQGYYEAYLSVRIAFLKYADTRRRLIVAGHSSGGAIAQIASVDANFWHLIKPEVITFGSPRCGNLAWADSAKKRIDNHSYVNLYDPVPNLLWRYKDVTPPITNNKYFCDPHHLKNYIKAIN